MVPDILTTFPELARKLAVKLETVYRWQVRHDTFPSSQVCPTCGYTPVLPVAQVDTWLEETGRK